LWRGSRDGFEAQEFHRRCDGHSNTLTVILDTEGNIFGGFTPVEWESPPSWKGKADDSVKSFVFTLKNPHNISARRFALIAKEKDWAISCDSERGPCFGCVPSDIYVCDDCISCAGSHTSLGPTYIKDSGLAREIVFTGSKHFQVKEIDVFEIAA
jgi:hypothetical protein